MKDWFVKKTLLILISVFLFLRFWRLGRANDAWNRLGSLVTPGMQSLSAPDSTLLRPLFYLPRVIKPSHKRGLLDPFFRDIRRGNIILMRVATAANNPRMTLLTALPRRQQSPLLNFHNVFQLRGKLLTPCRFHIISRFALQRCHRQTGLDTALTATAPHCSRDYGGILYAPRWDCGV